MSAKEEKEYIFKGHVEAAYDEKATHAYVIGGRKFKNSRISFRGRGDFTHVGSSLIMGKGIWVWDESLGTLTNEIVITADDGKVYVRVTGTQTARSGDDFWGTYIIWGGSGRYAKAYGTGRASGKISAASIAISLDGMIIYPYEPKPQPPNPYYYPPYGDEAPKLEPRRLIPNYAAAPFWPHLEGIMIVEKDVPVPMRDGVRLAADVYRPAEPGKYPVILVWTIFLKDYYWQPGHPGFGVGYEPWIAPVTGSAPFEAPDPAFWVPHGYAVVVVDPTGSGRSAGKRNYDPLDIYDAIEWASAQEWSNGNVGMSGVSALGTPQVEVAPLNPPSLKAIAPGWPAFLYSPWSTGGIQRTLPIKEMLTTYVHRLPAWDSPERERATWRDARPWYQQFADIKVPVLLFVPLTDHQQMADGALNFWRFVGSSEKWIYFFKVDGSKWAHWYSSEALTLQKMFFDHYLKGTDDRILSVPQVRLEVLVDRTQSLVRWERSWPIPAVYQKLYLDASDRRMKPEKPEAASSASYLSTAKEYVAFDYTFAKDTELTGFGKLVLWFSPKDSNDADIFITLLKLDAEGKEIWWDGYASPGYYPVALTSLRISNRELDPTLSTDYYPILKRESGGNATVAPGEVVRLEIGIPFFSVLFRAGETLRLQISGVYRPEVDLSYTYPAFKGQTPYFWHLINKGIHTVYTGGPYDSFLLVPVHHATSSR